MKNIFITGMSGYIAARLARSLLAHTQVEKVVGIDIRPPDPDILDPACPALVFIPRDVREDVSDILATHEIDTIVHTAWVLAPDHDVSRMEEINVSGTQNILNAAAQSKIRQILYTSSATAYGFYPDNQIPLTEESPLRGNDDFTYAKNKKEMEKVFKAFGQKHPGTCVTVLRPCYVAGPGLDNPLSTHLKKTFVPLIRNTAPFQYVHEDDLIRIMVICLEKRLKGAFNVAGEGTMEFAQMVEILGNTPVLLPEILVRIVNGLAWKLRLTCLTEFPNPALNLMRHPWIVSTEKLVRETGYEFEFNTLEAFTDFARHLNR